MKVNISTEFEIQKEKLVMKHKLHTTGIYSYIDNNYEPDLLILDGEKLEWNNCTSEQKKNISNLVYNQVRLNILFS